MLDDDETYLGAENNLNLFTVAATNAMTDGEPVDSKSRASTTSESSSTSSQGDLW